MLRAIIIGAGVIGLAVIATLALTGHRVDPEVTAQRATYLANLCNEIRSVDEDLAATHDPAERAHLQHARQIRVWLYNDRSAALLGHEYEAAELPARIGAETPEKCGVGS